MSSAWQHGGIAVILKSTSSDWDFKKKEEEETQQNHKKLSTVFFSTVAVCSTVAKEKSRLLNRGSSIELC